MVGKDIFIVDIWSGRRRRQGRGPEDEEGKAEMKKVRVGFLIQKASIPGAGILSSRFDLTWYIDIPESTLLKAEFGGVGVIDTGAVRRGCGSLAWEIWWSYNACG